MLDAQARQALWDLHDALQAFRMRDEFATKEYLKVIGDQVTRVLAEREKMKAKMKEEEEKSRTQYKHPCIFYK